MSKKIEGIFAPIATPYQEDGNIDIIKYSENVKKFGRTGLAGIVSLGSNGEFVMLSKEEKILLLKATRESLPADKLLIAGTGCESLRDTIELTKVAADVGADAALIINPSYHKRDLTEESMLRFFELTADESPIPVMIYNMPGNSGINLSSSLITKLSKHPNITGVKDSGGNIVQIAETIAGASESFSVFAGSGSFLFATLMLGGKGGTLAVANAAPDFCSGIYSSVMAKEYEKARKMQLDLLPLNAAVTTKYGIGGMKAAMELAGFNGGLPRMPILPAKESAREEIRNIMEKLGLVGKYA